MDYETIRAVQVEQLWMMKKLHQICEQNGFSYILAGGTLLGAVRHGGFIPWDDDLDIWLPREDYEKLVLYLKQHPPKHCFLQDFSTEAHCVLPFAKLRLDKTEFRERPFSHINMHHGIYIDIFPCDRIKSPSSIGAELRHRIHRLIGYAIQIRERSGASLRTTWKRKVVSLVCPFLKVIPKHFLIYLMNRIVIRENRDWEYFAIICFYYYPISRTYCRQSAFEHRILRSFEDAQFWVPSDYASMLTALYGDYSQLPPTAERIPQHDIVAVAIRGKKLFDCA
jgi:lipopolysaccharide cholinephosphotransferase